jgi:hypothetical protein
VFVPSGILKEERRHSAAGRKAFGLKERFNWIFLKYRSSQVFVLSGNIEEEDWTIRIGQ